MNQFSLMPYFPTDHVDITVNRVHFFNVTTFKDKYLSIVPLKETIAAFCALYVDDDSKPLSSPTLVVMEADYSFRQLTPELLTDLDRYALSLLFSSLVENDETTVCISEQFTLVHQNFIIPDSSITFSTGSFYRVHNWRSLSTTRLVRPAYVPKETIPYGYDERLMQGLANMIDAHDPEDSRCFEVLAWVRYAFLNADGYSYASRVVMMATAFEIFFDLPEHCKEDEFANRLEALLGVAQMDILDEHCSCVSTGHPPISKANARGKNKTSTIYGWWAREFYSLRSKIVHEGVVTKNDLLNSNGEQHLILALRMLRFCLYRKLEQRGFIVFETLKSAGSFNGFSYEKHKTECKLREIETVIA